MPRKNRRRQKRRQPRNKFTNSVRTVVAPGNRYRTILSDNVSSSGAIGSVTQLRLELKGARYSGLFSKVSQLKINRIAITILPQTYLEFCIRGLNSPSLDTRAELINQADCLKLFVVTKPRTIWFKQNQTSVKGWLDVASAETFNSGMWIYYTGQNQLNTSGSEILFQIQFDVSFQGVDFLT